MSTETNAAVENVHATLTHEAVPLVVPSDVEQTTLGFWVSDSDPHGAEWKAYGELSTKAEGENLDRFQAYVESAYSLRALMVAHVSEQGDTYKRELFVKKASAVQMASGVAADLSSEKSINRKLMLFGIVALIRSRIVDNVSAPDPIRSFEASAPNADWYGGNLSRATLMALSPLFQSSSKGKANTGADVFNYKDPLYEKFALEVFAGLKACTIPRSDSYVSDKVSKHIASVAAYYEKKRLLRLTSTEQEQAAAKAAAKVRDDKINRAMGRIDAAAEEMRQECGLTFETVRDKMISSKIIPEATPGDLMGYLAKPESRSPVVQALAQQGLSESDSATLCQLEPNRVALIEALAATITESEAKLLGQKLSERYKTDPSAGKACVAVKLAIAPVLKVMLPKGPVHVGNGKAVA